VNNIAQALFARRGAVYLSGFGAVGVLLAVFLAVTAFAEIRMGRFSGGFGSLMIGVFLGAASLRVLKLGRDARSAIQRRLEVQ